MLDIDLAAGAGGVIGAALTTHVFASRGRPELGFAVGATLAALIAFAAWSFGRDIALDLLREALRGTPVESRVVGLSLLVFGLTAGLTPFVGLLFRPAAPSGGLSDARAREIEAEERFRPHVRARIDADAAPARNAPAAPADANAAPTVRAER